jgi:hypothetical protein
VENTLKCLKILSSYPLPPLNPPKFQKTGDPAMFVFTFSVFLESFMRFGEKKIRERKKEKKKKKKISLGEAITAASPGR